MTKNGSARQLGRICMDMAMIDLTDKPDVDVGSEIEIFGRNNSLDDMAKAAGTIPYELTCAVCKRVPRIYIENGKSGNQIARIPSRYGASVVFYNFRSTEGF